MAIPLKDALLVQWAANADAKLTATPAVWGYTAPQAVAFHAAAQGYIDAYNAMMQAREDGTRSESLTAIKDTNRLALLDLARPLYAAVQASKTISDADKILLGVHVRDTTPTPEPIPAFAPLASIVAVDGNTVTLRLRDAQSPDSKRRPIGTLGSSVFSYVGEEAPTDPAAYKFEGNTGKTRVDVAFAPTVTPGTTVWLTAFWFNGSKQSGPACNPISAVVNYGGSMPIAA